MAVLKPERGDQMFMESVQFAKQEVEQRQKAPVIVKAEETGREDDGVTG